MKYIPFLIEILKAADKRDRKNWLKTNYQYGVTDKSVGVIVDGAYIVFVPRDYFYLDIPKIFRGQAPHNLERLVFDKEGYTVPAEDTGVTKTVVDDNKVRIFETKKSEIWIDEKILKYFELDKSTFRGSDHKSPLYIYEESNLGKMLVGMVLSVNPNLVDK